MDDLLISGLNDFRKSMRKLIMDVKYIYRAANFTISEEQTVNSIIRLLDSTMDIFIMSKEKEDV